MMATSPVKLAELRRMAEDMHSRVLALTRRTSPSPSRQNPPAARPPPREPVLSPAMSDVSSASIALDAYLKQHESRSEAPRTSLQPQEAQPSLAQVEDTFVNEWTHKHHKKKRRSRRKKGRHHRRQYASDENYVTGRHNKKHYSQKKHHNSREHERADSDIEIVVSSPSSSDTDMLLRLEDAHGSSPSVARLREDEKEVRESDREGRESLVHLSEEDREAIARNIVSALQSSDDIRPENLGEFVANVVEKSPFQKTSRTKGTGISFDITELSPGPVDEGEDILHEYESKDASTNTESVKGIQAIHIPKDDITTYVRPVVDVKSRPAVRAEEKSRRSTPPVSKTRRRLDKVEPFPKPYRQRVVESSERQRHSPKKSIERKVSSPRVSEGQVRRKSVRSPNRLYVPDLSGVHDMSGPSDVGGGLPNISSFSSHNVPPGLKPRSDKDIERERRLFAAEKATKRLLKRFSDVVDHVEKVKTEYEVAQRRKKVKDLDGQSAANSVHKQREGDLLRGLSKLLNKYENMNVDRSKTSRSTTDTEKKSVSTSPPKSSLLFESNPLVSSSTSPLSSGDEEYDWHTPSEEKDGCFSVDHVNAGRGFLCSRRMTSSPTGRSLDRSSMGRMVSGQPPPKPPSRLSIGDKIMKSSQQWYAPHRTDRFSFSSSHELSSLANPFQGEGVTQISTLNQSAPEIGRNGHVRGESLLATDGWFEPKRT